MDEGMTRSRETKVFIMGDLDTGSYTQIAESDMTETRKPHVKSAIERLASVSNRIDDIVGCSEKRFAPVCSPIKYDEGAKLPNAKLPGPISTVELANELLVIYQRLSSAADRLEMMLNNCEL